MQKAIQEPVPEIHVIVQKQEIAPGLEVIMQTQDIREYVQDIINPAPEEAAALDIPASSVMTSFEDAIAKITDELFSELRKHTRHGGPEDLKTALRSYINMLEDLYAKI